MILSINIMLVAASIGDLLFIPFFFWLNCAVYEVFERMAYYGISSNLIVYLTNKLHQGTVTSANNVTNWVGTIWITPILGAYIADAHLGRYWTFIIACIIYLSVMPHSFYEYKSFVSFLLILINVSFYLCFAKYWLSVTHTNDKLSIF